MPKSKPPRRRYRPLRRVDKFDEGMMTIYENLERANDEFQQRVTPFLDQIPARERVFILAQFAENRALITEGRADIFKPSATPVLDALMLEDAERRRLGAGR